MKKLNNISLVQFKAGDIGLSTDTSWVSKAILWFESLWTKNAKRSHAYALVGENLIVEALGKISLNPINKYEGRTTEVYRIPISDEERLTFRIGMMRRVNGAYGYLKYPLFMIDSAVTWVKGLFGKKEPFFWCTKTLGISNIPVCSQLVVWGIYKFTKYRFKNENGNEVFNWRVVNPDYLEDLLALPVNGAVKVFSSENDPS
jgi:hypothetical protein